MASKIIGQRMHEFTNALGNTLHRVFNLYRAYPRRLLDLSALAVGAAWVFGTVAGFIVAWLAWLLQLIPGSYAADFGFSVYYGMFDGQLGTVAGFTTLAFGLIATRVWREGEERIAQRSFGMVIGSISQRTWSVFGVLCLVLVLVKVVLFNPVLDLTGLRDPLFDGLGDDSLGPRKYRAMKWANDLVAEASSWLPVFMVILLLVKESGLTINRQRWRASVPCLCATLAMVFIYDSVEWNLIAVLKRFVFPMIGIPFEASLIPYVFQLMILIFLFALLFPALILAYTVPFEHWAGKGEVEAAVAEGGGAEP